MANHYVHGINKKKSNVTGFIPRVEHVAVTAVDFYPDGTVRARNHIVKVDKSTGQVRGHMKFNDSEV